MLGWAVFLADLLGVILGQNVGEMKSCPVRIFKIWEQCYDFLLHSYVYMYNLYLYFLHFMFSAIYTRVCQIPKIWR